MENIIGIDFGTTNSAVALYDGRSGAYPGETLLPSAVYIDDEGKTHVGASARNVARLHPERTVLSVKRAMGRGETFNVGTTVYSAERIASFIFAELVSRWEKSTGERVTKAVVSVPAYFDEWKRRAIEEAADQAGLEVARLVNEPTAASLAYRIEGRGNVLAYDIGGGTFDVSVLEAGDGTYRVLASRGDSHLGGDDFDRALVDLLAERFLEETGVELHSDALAMYKLRLEAERAKIELSSRLESQIEIPFIGANVEGACSLETVVTRSELEALVRSDVERTIRHTKGALADAGIRAEEIEHVLLIGGPTRMPIIRRRVAEVMGRDPESEVDPEFAVVRGAALQGAVIAGKTRKTVLVDVTPLGLGVETAGQNLVTLLPRNTVLPAHASAIFTTVADHQQRARVTVLQGEHRQAREDVVIGAFDLDGIADGAAGEPDIEVAFDIDVDGILHVLATDLATSRQHAIALQHPVSIPEAAAREAVEEARTAEIEELVFRREGDER